MAKARKESRRLTKSKYIIKLEPKSKLSSDDWRALAELMQELQCQEREWLDDIEEKQLKHCGVFRVSFGFEKMSLKDIKANFKADDLMFIARDSSSLKIIGFCAVERKYNLGWATCDGLIVKKEWRNKGIASAFLEMAFEKVKKDGLDSLDLRVSIKNKAAQALYKKLGFSKTAYQMERWVSY